METSAPNAVTGRMRRIVRLAAIVKELDPIPQFRATAKLGEFLEARFSQSF